MNIYLIRLSMAKESSNMSFLNDKPMDRRDFAKLMAASAAIRQQRLLCLALVLGSGIAQGRGLVA